MKNKKKKLTNAEIASLVIQGLTALAALITAIKWW